MSDTPIPPSDIILYRTEDGTVRMDVRTDGETVWLTQEQMAQLFGKAKSTINEHIKNVFAEGELLPERVMRKFGISEFSTKPTNFYNLEAIIAVGYRVKSPQGTSFRIWATERLGEYIVKGFVMDDARLKDPKGWDYFDELLARIREIRASEKRFYQKVRDLFALSDDYRADDHDAQLFFAEVQNKLLYAVTRHTAAELVVQRADPGAPNMALTSWSGSRVRKHDILTAKNYLSEDEVDTLNRLVVIFLEQAELRVKDRHALSLGYWRDNVDRLLAFNEKPILKGPGTMSHAAMKTIVEERYDQFDANRRADEVRQADADDLKALEDAAKKLGQGKPKNPS